MGKSNGRVLSFVPGENRRDIVTQRELQRLREMCELSRLIAERAATAADELSLRIRNGAKVEVGKIGPESLRGNLILAKVVGSGLGE